MIFLLLIAALLIGGLSLSYCSIRHMFDDIKRPPVDPAPDAFPLHSRSPYVSGYQPLHEPLHSEPPQGGSVIGGQSNRALLSLMQKIEREIAERTGEPVVGDLAKSIGRYYVAEQCYESAPSPTSEQEGTMSMECEVDYE